VLKHSSYWNLGREAALAFTLPVAGRASLVLYDVAGRRVRTLLDGERAAGAHELRWDRATDDGGRAPAGVYFYRLSAGGRDVSRRLVVVD
jgi:flagellar hook assembly protein FlgD